MKTADLYIRVSTDEQADKGYSQRNQEEQLRKYCSLNNLSVGKVIYEDHSAKSFNRPEWTKLLTTLKKRRSEVMDFILFTKWDRFSRNTADAYQMISILRKLGTEPQAIEQPLDLSIPENKMMLAFYLAVPEVENDRRALNVFFGMRRAKKEGRWVATAPLGYKNRITRENGNKYIAPHAPYSEIMKWCFEQLSTGHYKINDVLRQARKKGLKCSKNNFHVAMHNPIYCGKIFIPTYKDEEACTVQGLHEPIVCEKVFKLAQDVMDGRRKLNTAKMVSLEELPLRGFLICPKCGRNLTGSPSKGKTKWYHYYHCVSPCNYRCQAKILNENFVKMLKEYSPVPAMKEIYAEVLEYQFKEKMKGSELMKRKLKESIIQVKQQMVEAREMLFKKEIKPKAYNLMDEEAEEKLKEYEEELEKLSVNYKELKALMLKLSNTLENIDLIYSEADIEIKRKIISTLFPEKLEIENEGYRTPKVNEGAEFIYQLNKVLAENKIGTDCNINNLSHKVIPLGFEPRTTTLKV